jgi:hypothetical protein
MVISGWTVAPKGTGGGIQACVIFSCRTLPCRLSAFPGRLMALERNKVFFLVKKKIAFLGLLTALARHLAMRFAGERQGDMLPLHFTVTSLMPHRIEVCLSTDDLLHR